MAAPDPAAVVRFRDAVAAALAASDRPAFDAAVRALAAATHLPIADALAAAPVHADPHLRTLLALAADLQWLYKDPHPVMSPAPPPLPTHIFRPPSVPPRPFVPTLPPHPIPLPTALAPSPAGPKASFRAWKWNRTQASPLDSLHAYPAHPFSTAPHAQPHAPNPPFPPRYSAPDDDDLFVAMHPTAATRPAAAAAAAAFRALAPFLRPRARALLRSTMASSTPLQALSAVMRAAHMACTDDPDNVSIPVAAVNAVAPPAWPPDQNGMSFAAQPDDQRTAGSPWPASHVWSPDAREAAWGSFSPHPTGPSPGAGATGTDTPSQLLSGTQARADSSPGGALRDVRAPFLTHPSLDSPG